MESKKAGQLKRNLNLNYHFDTRKVHGISKLKDWNIVVFELNNKAEKRSSLTKYNFMIMFAKKNECGLLIEATGSIPYYLLY